MVLTDYQQLQRNLSCVASSTFSSTWLPKSGLLVELATSSSSPTDTSFGMVAAAYSVDIPMCWCDRIDEILMITLMLGIMVNRLVSR